MSQNPKHYWEAKAYKDRQARWALEDIRVMIEEGEALKLAKLDINRQRKIDEEVRAGQKLFMGIPDRWYEDVTFRCVNGHVSKAILKSEVKGDSCLACGGAALLTFPEDKEDV